MKNIIRVLSLSGALILAISRLAKSEVLGPCRYVCWDLVTPLPAQSFTVYSTKSQCCSGEVVTCPPGMILRAVTWGSPQQRCT